MPSHGRLSSISCDRLMNGEDDLMQQPATNLCIKPSNHRQLNYSLTHSSTLQTLKLTTRFSSAPAFYTPGLTEYTTKYPPWTKFPPDINPGTTVRL